MHRLVGVILIGVVLQGCSMLMRRTDTEAALFASLFDVPQGTCKQLRADLRAEIEGIKTAKKKAEDDFIAEQEAPPKESRTPRSLRKEDPLAALREWTKRTQQAEKLNAALKERSCRTVDIEAAVK